MAYNWPLKRLAKQTFIDGVNSLVKNTNDYAKVTSFLLWELQYMGSILTLDDVGPISDLEIEMRQQYQISYIDEYEELVLLPKAVQRKIYYRCLWIMKTDKTYQNVQAHSNINLKILTEDDVLASIRTAIKTVASDLNKRGQYRMELGYDLIYVFCIGEILSFQSFDETSDIYELIDRLSNVELQLIKLMPGFSFEYYLSGITFEEFKNDLLDIGNNDTNQYLMNEVLIEYF